MVFTNDAMGLRAQPIECRTRRELVPSGARQVWTVPGEAGGYGLVPPPLHP
jgi:hypothetical protein